MSLTLRPPVRSLDSLRAIAGAGVPGVSPKAKAELRARINAEIRAELAKREGR